jgi:hypothetical protein
VSEREGIYDAISYHQGSVWPLFTGWVSLAEYRAGHPLSGYAHLMQNADLTWSQDLGDVTELLSGRFFVPLGRSTAHQLWSSAMVISPALRGLFGLEWNAPENTLRVTPQLPADWQDATLRDVPFGNAKLDLKFTRAGSDLAIEAVQPPAGLQLATRSPGARVAGNILHIPLPDVEVAMSHALPEFGAETKQLKVLDQEWTPRQYSLTLSGSGGSTYQLLLRENAANLHVHAEGAALGPLVHGLRTATVIFPANVGYTTRAVTFQW